MKKLITLLSLLVITAATYANTNCDQVLVLFGGQIVNILDLSKLEGNGLNALLQLRKAACYTGNQYDVIHTLNDVFNMPERNRIANAWPIRFRQATTPNIPEQNSGLSNSVGVEYEVKSGNYPIVRFTINRCK